MWEIKGTGSKTKNSLKVKNRKWNKIMLMMVRKVRKNMMRSWFNKFLKQKEQERQQ